MKREEFNQKHARVTRSLKEFIVGYEKKLEPDVYGSFLASIDEELVTIYDKLMAIPAGTERARALHLMVEEEMAQEDKIKVSCSKGCSACCHFEVEVTNYEADILAEIAQSTRPINRDALRIQSHRKVQDKAWLKGIHDFTNRCVFLGDDKACSIYESRPVMCRRHSVTSPPLNCETQNAPIGLRFFPRVDLLISAANEDPGLRIGPMAKMISLKLK
jgi:Fe-S-cluster containining protein